MSTVLYIKANPKSVSRTLEIADRFMEIYRQNNPQDTVITLDLYQENINFLSEEMALVDNSQAEQDREHPIFSYAHQFFEADKYVFAEPLWNLGVPAILKAYFDYISVAGITFKYTETGPVGLCQGKAVNITTRGGEYSDGPHAALEMGDRYIKTILGFLGIADYTTIAANNLDIVGADVEAILARARQEAETLAKTF